MSNKTFFEMINSEAYKGYKDLTYKQLCNIAKEKKIKYYGRYKKNELEKILGLEISVPNKKNPVKIIALNKKTGEILKFKSIHSAGKNFNMNPGSIVWLINKKKDLRFFGESFLISYG